MAYKVFLNNACPANIEACQIAFFTRAPKSFREALCRTYLAVSLIWFIDDFLQGACLGSAVFQGSVLRRNSAAKRVGKMTPKQMSQEAPEFVLNSNLTRLFSSESHWRGLPTAITMNDLGCRGRFRPMYVMLRLLTTFYFAKRFTYICDRPQARHVVLIPIDIALRLR